MNPLLLSGIFEVGKSIISRLFPDPEAKAAAELKLLEMQQSGELAQLSAATALATAQIGVNLEEAKSTNWFVAGGRPFVMWTCGVAFAYSYVILPFSMFFVYVFGSPETVEQLTMLPKLDLVTMMPVLLGMLGLGGYRTFEKRTGTENNR